MSQLIEKKLNINLAIEEDDLIYVDELLVRPHSIVDGNKLKYMNLMTLDNEECFLGEVSIKSFEENL